MHCTARRVLTTICERHLMLLYCAANTVIHCLQGLAAEVHDLLQGNSLYLVGMMGSGKSTVGRLVGKALKYPLLDTDALIEQSSKATVSKIFAEEGEESFRDMETEVLHVSQGTALLALHPFISLSISPPYV